jgi:hypothetical protein
MNDLQRLTKCLDKLRMVLEENGEEDAARNVRRALAGTEREFAAFLASNRLWGGAGSIADQAGLQGGRTDSTRAIESALIGLGEEQIRQGIVNVRTQMWTDAFRQWKVEGI